MQTIPRTGLEGKRGEFESVGAILTRVLLDLDHARHVLEDRRDRTWFDHELSRNLDHMMHAADSIHAVVASLAPAAVGRP